MTARVSIYFTDIFEIDPSVLDGHGAFNIALVNDLPLFVDPFLLFDSEHQKYRDLHDEIIRYLRFLRDRAIADELTEANITHWLRFKEVHQNWLGFSKSGNRGTGLGRDFASSLAKNLKTVFRNFGDETVSEGSHIEKLGLLSGGVGRDHLSDFTTNLIKGFLLEYTQEFARKHLRPEHRRVFAVERVFFSYETRRWRAAKFELPCFSGDYVLLTPKEILTRDEAWINQPDMLERFTDIVAAIPDADLRAQADEHFIRLIGESDEKEQRREAALKTTEKFPELLDYYIRWKEEHADEAHVESDKKVQLTYEQFVENVKTLVDGYLAGSDFYAAGDSYEECLRRVHFLKDVVENKGGHRVFYVDGKPVQREVDLHVMYRLTWFGTAHDVNPEVNGGRGPVDFKVSYGKADSSLVEFKLAKNTSLKKNLAHQVKIYEKASDAKRSIKVIVFFTEAELARVLKILGELGLQGREDVVTIDASLDTKVSASKADSS